MCSNDDIFLKVVRQLEDYQAWKVSSPVEFSLFDYIGCISRPDLLFAFAELFCPTLVLYNDHYFIESRFSEEVFIQWKNSGKSDSEIQKIMNHIHISTIFQNQDISSEVAVASAHTIAKIWKLVFGKKGLKTQTAGNDLHSAEVTLYQESPTNACS
jgi:hypothetical protein